MKNNFFYIIFFSAFILINCNKKNIEDAKSNEKNIFNGNYVKGKKLYTEYCIACHSLDGSNNQKMGPTFKGLYLKDRALTNGETIIADEEYLRRAILEPNKEIPIDFKRGPFMSSMGEFLSEDEIIFLINFIKEQK